MPRTVVPPAPKNVRGEGGGGGDSFPEKLVKYVPAEVLAFFIPAAAGIGADRDGLLWAAVAIAAVGTPAYLFQHARSASADKKPQPYFYVLAVLALLAWVLGTSANVADLINLDDVAAGFILAAAVFLIPLLDSFCEGWFPRTRKGG